MTDLAAIYTRVSTEEQAKEDKTSLEQQRERCAAYCHSQGWEVVEAYEDAGVSGTADPEWRPALSRLLEDAAAGKFQHLVFLKVDRVARSLRKLLNLSHQLQSLKVGLVSVVEQFDTSTASGQLYFNLLGAFAEFERAQINERMSEGRKGAVRRGRYLSTTVPFGYVRENGTLKPHKEQAKVVRQMFKWAREGLGIRVIAGRLEQLGAERPTPAGRESHWGWHLTTVYKVLTSPRYIGQSSYSGVLMPCPPLVDEETFNAVKAALKKRKRDSPRNTKRLYLLQHLLWCRHCGGRYMAKSTWSKAGPRAVYLCRQRTVYGQKAGHEGIKWRWDGKQLEVAIKRHVLRVLADPDYLADEAKVYQDDVKKRWGEYANQQGNLQAQLTRLEQQEARAAEGYTKGLYSEERLQEIQRGIHAQQAEVRAKLEALSMHEPAEELTKADKLRLLRDDVLFRFAYKSGYGVFRRMQEGETREGWVDRALAYLDQQTHIDVVVPGDEDQEWRVESIPVDQWWRDTTTSLVDEVWVEDDGTLTVKGTIEAATGRVEAEVSASTLSR